LGHQVNFLILALKYTLKDNFVILSIAELGVFSN
jgi:hypothetical protein